MSDRFYLVLSNTKETGRHISRKADNSRTPGLLKLQLQSPNLFFQFGISTYTCIATLPGALQLGDFFTQEHNLIHLPSQCTRLLLEQT
jgi:hypothetical protein